MYNKDKQQYCAAVPFGVMSIQPTPAILEKEMKCGRRYCGMRISISCVPGRANSTWVMPALGEQEK